MDSNRTSCDDVIPDGDDLKDGNKVSSPPIEGVLNDTNAQQTDLKANRALDGTKIENGGIDPKIPVDLVVSGETQGDVGRISGTSGAKEEGKEYCTPSARRNVPQNFDGNSIALSNLSIGESMNIVVTQQKDTTNLEGGEANNGQKSFGVSTSTSQPNDTSNGSMSGKKDCIGVESERKTTVECNAKGVCGKACEGSLYEKATKLLPDDLIEELEASGTAKPISKLSKEGVTYKSVVTGQADNTRSTVCSSVKLKYYSFEPGTPIIDLIPDEEAIVSLKRCLVGHFIGTKMYFPEVEKNITEQWCHLGFKEMICTENGFYIFQFHEENKMDDILDKGHCHVFGRVMVLKKWHQMLSLNKEAMEKIPIWIQIYGLPYEFWSADNLSKVASRIGRPLYMDQTTEKKARLTFARICVEIDASKELQKRIDIHVGGEVFEVEVRYQWIPKRCDTCKVFGHNSSLCPRSEGFKATKSDQYGPKQNQWYNRRWRGNYLNPNTHYVQKSPREMIQTEGWSKPVTQRNSKKNLVDRYGNVSNVMEINKGKPKENELKIGNSFEAISNSSEGKNSSEEKVGMERIMNIGSSETKGNLETKRSEGKVEREGYVQVSRKENIQEVTISGRKTCEVGNATKKGVNSEIPGYGDKVLEELQNSKIEKFNRKPTGGYELKVSNENKAHLIRDCATGNVDSGVFAAIGGDLSEDSIVGTITPTKTPKGLSVDDYPKNWSKKRIKSEMKAARNALEAKNRKLKPP